MGAPRPLTVEAIFAHGPLIGHPPDGLTWSPDGKQIAYAWQEIHEGNRDDMDTKETTSTLIVCDPEGKNQKTIASEKGKGFEITIDSISWR